MVDKQFNWVNDKFIPVPRNKANIVSDASTWKKTVWSILGMAKLPLIAVNALVSHWPFYCYYFIQQRFFTLYVAFAPKNCHLHSLDWSSLSLSLSHAVSLSVYKTFFIQNKLHTAANATSFELFVMHVFVEYFSCQFVRSIWLSQYQMMQNKQMKQTEGAKISHVKCGANLYINAQSAHLPRVQCHIHLFGK